MEGNSESGGKRDRRVLLLLQNVGLDELFLDNVNGSFLVPCAELSVTQISIAGNASPRLFLLMCAN